MKLSKYLITYTEKNDPGSPDFTMTVKAYSKEHAEDKFYDDDDPDWNIVSIKKL